MPGIDSMAVASKHRPVGSFWRACTSVHMLGGDGRRDLGGGCERLERL